jgi:hypothetical protein
VVRPPASGSRSVGRSSWVPSSTSTSIEMIPAAMRSAPTAVEGSRRAAHVDPGATPQNQRRSGCWCGIPSLPSRLGTTRRGVTFGPRQREYSRSSAVASPVGNPRCRIPRIEGRSAADRPGVALRHSPPLVPVALAGTTLVRACHSRRGCPGSLRREGAADGRNRAGRGDAEAPLRLPLRTHASRCCPFRRNHPGESRRTWKRWPEPSPVLRLHGKGGESGSWMPPRVPVGAQCCHGCPPPAGVDVVHGAGRRRQRRA